jgi:hypothetical protein
VKKKKEDVPWNEAITLAEWCERMLRQGYTAIVMNMIGALPDNSATKIRVLKYMKAMEARKKNANKS